MCNDLKHRIESLENALKKLFPSEEWNRKILFCYANKDLFFSLSSCSFSRIGETIILELADSKDTLFFSFEEEKLFRMDMMTQSAMLSEICAEIENKAALLPKSKLRFLLAKDEIGDLERYGCSYYLQQEYDENEAYNLLDRVYSIEAGLVECDASAASRIANIADKISKQINNGFHGG